MLLGRNLGLAAIATVSALALTAPAQSANLLVNGSFESGFTGWTLGGSSGDGYPPVVIPYNSNSGYPGGAFGEPIPPDNAVGNPGFDPVGDHAVYFVADLANPQTLSQMVNIVNGTSYTFGFDVYVPLNGAQNPNDATFTATVGGYTFASFNASSQPVQQWIHYSSSGVATGTGAVSFDFEYNSFGIPAKDFVVDRVYFAPTASIPEPLTWAMMVVGFGAIGASMRRRAAKTRVSFA